MTVAIFIVLTAASWLAVGARSAYSELSAGRDDLVSAREAMASTDLAGTQKSFTAATIHARAAADEVQGSLWGVAAALPGIGSTVQVVRAVASSFDEALAGLDPAVETITGLDPGTLVAGDGRIDLAALQAAAGPLQSASEGIATASQTLAAAPSRADGDHVIAQVDDAAVDLGVQLTQIARTLGGALTTVRIAPPLLGAEGPKRYFVAILNPNESRGTGGFLGTFVILRAHRGRLAVERVGSNSELATLPSIPADLGEQYLERYGQDPRLVANMNISAHYPAAAELWLESWRINTGETLDGAFSADVVALGSLVSATGEQVPLPDGGSLTGEELTSFAVSGIYEKFPQPDNVSNRKAYQEAVTAAAFDIVRGSANRAALASALGAALTERRIQLWAADGSTQADILAAGLGGSLRVPNGHSAAFVAINNSGSKLDAYLRTALVYEVGRCPIPSGRMVESRVTARVTSDIPEGSKVPDYMISLAERGPDGPVNSTLAQIHLPMDAEIVQVELDGRPIGWAPFLEQDRTSLVVPMELPPRVERHLVVNFLEPAAGGPGVAPAQPLVAEPDSAVVDRECSRPTLK